jgi:hypothetical protein
MRKALLTGLVFAAPLRRMSRRRAALGAFAIYLAVSFLAFGLRLLIEPGSQYIGSYDDPQIPIWSFAWWPHALLHGQNPFFTHAVWAPAGVNLAWVNSVPAVSVAFAPLTLVVGPIASYNVAAIALPAVSAWAAFLLCRHLTGKWWPSLVGGYLFGFSSYVLGHVTGQPQLTAAFVLPLLALVILRFVEGTTSSKRFTLLAGLLLALQLFISMEVAFTLTIVLAGALLIGYGLAPTLRRRLLSAVPRLLVAYAIAAVLASPFLYYALTSVRVSGFQTPSDFVADLLNVIVPTHVEAAGAGRLHDLSKRFPGNYTEQGAFIGLPVLAIVVLFARRCWSSAFGRFLLAGLALTLVASLGPELTVGGRRVAPIPTPFGHETVTLPGMGTKFLPLFDNALPVRFALYTALAVAMIVAVWMASRPAGDALVWLLPALAILILVPNPAANIWSTTYTIPPFFTDARYRTCLAPNENVLPQPVRAGGPEMLWQAVDGFRFRLAGGRLQTSAPSSFLHPPSIAVISIGNPPEPGRSKLLAAYIRAKGVTSAIVDKDQAALWTPALDRLAKRRDVGGVLLYRFARTDRACPSS